MPDQAHVDLSKYRLEAAAAMLRDAEVLYEQGSYKSSNNRAYYAMFHATRALLALEGVDFKKHSAIISYFQSQYIKTGLIDKACAKMLLKASTIRNASDYNDFFIASREETRQQIENAGAFLTAITEYMEKAAALKTV